VQGEVREKLMISNRLSLIALKIGENFFEVKEVISKGRLKVRF